MEKKVKIILGVSGGLLTSYFAYHFFNKKYLIKELNKQMKGGGILLQNKYGDLRDFEQVLTGSPYMSKVKGKIGNNDLVMLNRSAITQFREDLHDAMTGFGGDNETSVYDTFSNINDLYEVSQVAQSYQDHYGKSLYQEILDNLDTGYWFTDSEQGKVYNILKTKTKFRIKK